MEQDAIGDLKRDYINRLLVEKKRMDGRGDYLCANFAGPIRNAGGTAAAVCVIIVDYVRKKKP